MSLKEVYTQNVSKRPAMIGSVIRTAISPVLRECPPECGMVSITEVNVSPDLTYATVMVSALSNVALALKFLDSKKGMLQAKLAGMASHRTPKLRFREDTALQGALRIDELLDRESKKYPEDTSASSQAQGR
jgi:ribosome-binding factor A